MSEGSLMVGVTRVRRERFSHPHRDGLLDVNNVPFDPRQRYRGTLFSWEVTNVPRLPVEASKGTLTT
jgi:hypothetical protein